MARIITSASTTISSVVTQCLHANVIQLLHHIPIRADDVRVERYVRPETMLGRDI